MEKGQEQASDLEPRHHSRSYGIAQTGCPSLSLPDETNSARHVQPRWQPLSHPLGPGKPTRQRAESLLVVTSNCRPAAALKGSNVQHISLVSFCLDRG